MPRYTLYREESATIDDASEHIRKVGAKLIVARPGLALIEASEAVAQKLRDKLKDWVVTQENKAAIPRPPKKVGGKKKQTTKHK